MKPPSPARTPRSRKAQGPDRPTYLTSQDTDRVMSIVLALMSEVTSLRERLDTHERLGDEGCLPYPAAVEAFRASETVEDERATWRSAFLKRLLRVIVEDVENLALSGLAEPGNSV